MCVTRQRDLIEALMDAEFWADAEVAARDLKREDEYHGNLYLARIASAKGNPLASIRLVNKAVRKNPKNWYGYLVRANILSENGRLDSAQLDYAQAIDLNRRARCAIVHDQVVSCLRNGCASEALLLIDNKLAECRRWAAEVAKLRAAALQELGEFQEAIRVCQRSASLHACSDYVRSALLAIEAEAVAASGGSKRRARALAWQSLRLHDRNEQALRVLRTTPSRFHRNAENLQVWLDVIDPDPTDATLRCCRSAMVVTDSFARVIPTLSRIIGHKFEISTTHASSHSNEPLGVYSISAPAFYRK